MRWRIVRAATAALLGPVLLQAQICRLSVAGLNRNRRVAGPVSAECPAPLHTAPFGNWGVTSNFGPKRNGRQFDGWCRDMRICDNAGNCRQACRDGWYEWNTCTTHPLYVAPNCTLYNADHCTSQVSTTGVNVLGTQTVDLPAACPASDGVSFQRGGCAELTSYTRSSNYMSVYELDPVTGDELIQSLYYPSLSVALQCNVWGCLPAGSEWTNPIQWQSPAEPKVFAEMAMVVNSATFVDPLNVCRITPVGLEVVSAASFQRGEVAPDSIASLFAGEVTAQTEQASAQPLPTTLSGVQVRVVDSAGQSRTAALLYASPRQINFIVPAGLREGSATVSVVSGNTVRASGRIHITRFAPGIFSQSGTGDGLAAAVGVRVGPDGRQTVVSTQPFDLGGPSEQFVLVLFGTGIRAIPREAVQVLVGGAIAEVQYAGAQGSFAGLDQVNALLPRSLAGRGRVNVQLVAGGKAANVVQIWIQ
ncbi:MAG: hypothetical protein NZV14_06375 [Bryobacteraceae bacterium]|nr:hypothetical protein [Bryobacteraceae bacterium]MDW8377768.1 hypothetical protein [Bryobacterales bacterium]